MSFPNETSEYRAARDALLASELALRGQMEAVAAQLRALPPGGEVPEDYPFDATDAGGAATVIRMSELFRLGRQSRRRGTSAHRTGRRLAAAGLFLISGVLFIDWRQLRL